MSEFHRGPAPVRDRAGPCAERLTELLAEISTCRLCRERPEGAPMLHEPRPVLMAGPAARILVAGQAPGMRVHKSGTPFTDQSGVRLRHWMGVDEDVFYDTGSIAIVPVGLCFPGYDKNGGDLPPRRECAPAWRARILACLEDLRLILVIGQYAQMWHLGARRQRSLTATVSAWRDYANPDCGPAIMPLPHPSWRNNAWLKNNRWFDRELLPHLRHMVAGALA